MWNETMNRLDSLARSVREGKRVLEAADFCRWLQFSGFVKVFDLFPESASEVIVLRVDSKAVRKKIDDLIFDCGEWFKEGKVSPKYAESDIAEINTKLDQLLKQKGDGMEGVKKKSPRHTRNLLNGRRARFTLGKN